MANLRDYINSETQRLSGSSASSNPNSSATTQSSQTTQNTSSGQQASTGGNSLRDFISSETQRLNGATPTAQTGSGTNATQNGTKNGTQNGTTQNGVVKSATGKNNLYAYTTSALLNNQNTALRTAAASSESAAVNLIYNQWLKSRDGMSASAAERSAAKNAIRGAISDWNGKKSYGDATYSQAQASAEPAGNTARAVATVQEGYTNGSGQTIASSLGFGNYGRRDDAAADIAATGNPDASEASAFANNLIAADKDGNVTEESKAALIEVLYQVALTKTGRTDNSETRNEYLLQQAQKKVANVTVDQAKQYAASAYRDYASYVGTYTNSAVDYLYQYYLWRVQSGLDTDVHTSAYYAEKARKAVANMSTDELSKYISGIADTYTYQAQTGGQLSETELQDQYREAKKAYDDAVAAQKSWDNTKQYGSTAYVGDADDISAKHEKAVAEAKANLQRAEAQLRARGVEAPDTSLWGNIKNAFTPDDTTNTNGFTKDEAAAYNALLARLKEMQGGTEYEDAAYQKEYHEILDKLHQMDANSGRDARAYTGNERANLFLTTTGNNIAKTYNNLAGQLLQGNSTSIVDYLEQRKAEYEKDYNNAVMWNGEDSKEAKAEKAKLEANENYQDLLKQIEDAKANPNVQRGTAFADKFDGKADPLFERADKYKEKADAAKEQLMYGKSDVGKFLTEAGLTGMEMLQDTAVGAATGIPGMGLVNMGIRVFSNTAQESRLEGDSFTTQNQKAMAAALIEVFTEKMFGPFEAAYGKALISPAVNKFVKSKVLQVAINTFGEGFEEYASSFLNTVVDHLNGWDDGTMSFWEDWDSQKEQVLYEFLLGAALGFVGSAGQVVTNNLAGSKASESGENAPTVDAPKVSEGAPLTGADALYDTATQGQQTRITPLTQEQTTAQETLAAVDGVNLDAGRVNSTAANAIIANPELARAFTALTGIQLEGNTAQMRQQISQGIRAFGYRQVQEAEQQRADAEAQEQAARDEAKAEAESLRKAAEDAQQAENVQNEANAALAEYSRQEAEREARIEEGVRNARGETAPPVNVNSANAVDTYIQNLISGGISSYVEAKAMLRNPALRAAWERITGIKLPKGLNAAAKIVVNYKGNVDTATVEAEANTTAEQPTAPAQSQPVKTGADILADVALGQNAEADTAQSEADILAQRAAIEQRQNEASRRNSELSEQRKALEAKTSEARQKYGIEDDTQLEERINNLQEEKVAAQDRLTKIREEKESLTQKMNELRPQQQSKTEPPATQPAENKTPADHLAEAASKPVEVKNNEAEKERKRRIKRAREEIGNSAYTDQLLDAQVRYYELVDERGNAGNLTVDDYAEVLGLIKNPFSDDTVSPRTRGSDSIYFAETFARMLREELDDFAEGGEYTRRKADFKKQFHYWADGVKHAQRFEHELRGKVGKEAFKSKLAEYIKNSSDYGYYYDSLDWEGLVWELTGRMNDSNLAHELYEFVQRNIGIYNKDSARISDTVEKTSRFLDFFENPTIENVPQDLTKLIDAEPITVRSEQAAPEADETVNEPELSEEVAEPVAEEPPVQPEPETTPADALYNTATEQQRRDYVKLEYQLALLEQEELELENKISQNRTEANALGGLQADFASQRDIESQIAQAESDFYAAEEEASKLPTKKAEPAPTQTVQEEQAPAKQEKATPVKQKAELTPEQQARADRIAEIEERISQLESEHKKLTDSAGTYKTAAEQIYSSEDNINAINAKYQPELDRLEKKYNKTTNEQKRKEIMSVADAVSKEWAAELGFVEQGIKARTNLRRLAAYKNREASEIADEYYQLLDELDKLNYEAAAEGRLLRNKAIEQSKPSWMKSSQTTDVETEQTAAEEVKDGIDHLIDAATPQNEQQEQKGKTTPPAQQNSKKTGYKELNRQKRKAEKRREQERADYLDSVAEEAEQREQQEQTQTEGEKRREKYAGLKSTLGTAYMNVYQRIYDINVPNTDFTSASGRVYTPQEQNVIIAANRKITGGFKGATDVNMDKLKGDVVSGRLVHGKNPTEEFVFVDGDRYAKQGLVLKSDVEALAKEDGFLENAKEYMAWRGKERGRIIKQAQQVLDVSFNELLPANVKGIDGLTWAEYRAKEAAKGNAAYEASENGEVGEDLLSDKALFNYLKAQSYKQFKGAPDEWASSDYYAALARQFYLNKRSYAQWLKGVDPATVAETFSGYKIEPISTKTVENYWAQTRSGVRDSMRLNELIKWCKAIDNDVNRTIAEAERQAHLSGVDKDTVGPLTMDEFLARLESEKQRKADERAEKRAERKRKADEKAAANHRAKTPADHLADVAASVESSIEDSYGIFEDEQLREANADVQEAEVSNQIESRRNNVETTGLEALIDTVQEGANNVRKAEKQADQSADDRHSDSEGVERENSRPGDIRDADRGNRYDGERGNDGSEQKTSGRGDALLLNHTSKDIKEVRKRLSNPENKTNKIKRFDYQTRFPEYDELKKNLPPQTLEEATGINIPYYAGKKAVFVPESQYTQELTDLRDEIRSRISEDTKVYFVLSDDFGTFTSKDADGRKLVLINLEITADNETITPYRTAMHEAFHQRLFSMEAPFRFMKPVMVFKNIFGINKFSQIMTTLRIQHGNLGIIGTFNEFLCDLYAGVERYGIRAADTPSLRRVVGYMDKTAVEFQKSLEAAPLVKGETLYSRFKSFMSETAEGKNASRMETLNALINDAAAKNGNPNEVPELAATLFNELTDEERTEMAEDDEEIERGAAEEGIRQDFAAPTPSTQATPMSREDAAKKAMQMHQQGYGNTQIFADTGMLIDSKGNVRDSNGEVVLPSLGNKVVQNQAHNDKTLYTRGERDTSHEQKTIAGKGKHIVQTDERVAEAAKQRIDDNGINSEITRLMQRSADAYDNLDVAELELIIRQKTKEARDFMLAQAKQMDISDFKLKEQEISDLQGKLEEVKTEAARTLRQVGGALTPTETISQRAMHIFLNRAMSQKAKTPDGNIDPNSKAAQKTREIFQYLSEIDSVADGDINAMTDIIQKLSKRRGTDKVLHGKVNSTASKWLSWVAAKEDGFEFLKNIAYAQTDGIITDSLSGFRGSVLEGLKSLRISNLLSNFSTWNNNFGNNVTAIVMNATGQNIGTLADIGLSKYTGTRTIAQDKSATLTKAQRDAIQEATIKSMLNVLYDVDTLDGSVKYESTGGNYFKMTGNAVERLLAQYQMLTRTTLVVPDNMAKSAIKAGMEPGMEKLSSEGKITSEAYGELMGDAQSQALYRTLQSDTKWTEYTRRFKEWMNKAHLTDKEGGTFGIGDMAAVFAKVPTNVLTQKLQNSPVGWCVDLINYAKAIDSAKKGELSAKEQAKVSRGVGRTINGVTMTLLSTVASALGFLKRFDDDDDDPKTAIDKSRGMSGLQWNFSAMFRFLSGKGVTDWQDGDVCIGGDWLEILALPMGLGYEMYESYRDGDNFGGYLNSAFVYSTENIIETLSSIPGMSFFENAYNSITYAQEGDETKAVFESIAGTIADCVGSMLVPNAYSQAVAGLDNTARDIYGTDSAWETALNILKQRSYFARQTIDPKVNAMGEEQKYGSNKFMGVMNKTFLPGDARNYTKTAYDEVVEELADAGITGLYPSKSAPKSFSVGEGDDAVEYTLTAGEKRDYLRTVGQTANELVSDLVGNSRYENLDVDEKADVIDYLLSFSRDAGKKDVVEERGDTYTSDIKLSKSDAIVYATGRELVHALQDGNGDYSEIDAFMRSPLYGYQSLSDAGKESLKGVYGRVDDIYEAYRVGINSKQWYNMYSKYLEYNEKVTDKTIEYSATDAATDFASYVDSQDGYNDEQRALLKDQLAFYMHIPGKSDRYDKLREAGFEPAQADSIYYSLKDTDANGNGSISQAEAYQKLLSMDLTEEERALIWSTFNSSWKTTYGDYKSKH